MTKHRIPLWYLMVLVLLVGVAVTALRSPTELWKSCLFSFTLGLLLFGLLGSMFRSGERRMFWVGLSLFGWGYLILVLSTGSLTVPPLPIEYLMGLLERGLASFEGFTTVELNTIPNKISHTPYLKPKRLHFFHIGHLLATIASALLGSVLVRVFGTKPPESHQMGKEQA